MCSHQVPQNVMLNGLLVNTQLPISMYVYIAQHKLVTIDNPEILVLISELLSDYILEIVMCDPFGEFNTPKET